jgi:exonuclease III
MTNYFKKNDQVEKNKNIQKEREENNNQNDNSNLNIIQITEKKSDQNDKSKINKSREEEENMIIEDQPSLSTNKTNEGIEIEVENKKKETYKIIAINIGGTIGDRLQGILKLLKEETPQILILTEVHKTKNKKIEDFQQHFKDYTLLHEEQGLSKRDFRRTVMLVADQLKGTTKQIKHQREEIVQIETIYQNTKLNIMGVYIPTLGAKNTEGEKGLIRDETTKIILEILEESQEEWIVMGDFNTKMNREIGKINEFHTINENFMTQAELPNYKDENTYEKTIRVHNKKGDVSEELTMCFTVPDGALITRGATESSVEKYQVMKFDHELSGDHKPIKIELQKDWITNSTGQIKKINPRTNGLKLKGRNEEKKKIYNEKIKEKANTINNLTINQKSEEITKILLESAKEAYGTIEIGNREKLSPKAAILNKYRNRIRNAIKSLKNPKTNEHTKAINKLILNPLEWQAQFDLKTKNSKKI